MLLAQIALSLCRCHECLNWAAMTTFFGKVCACCAKGSFKDKEECPRSLHDLCVEVIRKVNLGFQRNIEYHYDYPADDLCCLEWSSMRIVDLMLSQLTCIALSRTCYACKHSLCARSAASNWTLPGTVGLISPDQDLCIAQGYNVDCISPSSHVSSQ